jgi:hypothetical protein
MTPTELETAALTLFGFDFPWQRPLARALSVDDRLVRRWVSGERPIPEWVQRRISELAAHRRSDLEVL